ncbi:hypothetical protein Barb6XT_00185 [Bacteroidales bacterium Barb6XT]|nr:hypothetical protein Barb6XT_00185 [Bacteroidales bacterium Barb6XT]
MGKAFDLFFMPYCSNNTDFTYKQKGFRTKGYNDVMPMRHRFVYQTGEKTGGVDSIVFRKAEAKESTLLLLQA